MKPCTNAGSPVGAKDKDRAELAADIEAFLKAGGKIETRTTHWEEVEKAEENKKSGAVK
ncbi:hypothetical protein [Endozoicomonas acroporae]|uniref:hypothetical protein n=1 Tax=Endozoicomonas acroporae TaxID=1701104 RepID=UPI0013D39D7B|nr:hypothetical protein [Endozoicomonas acroporae]